MRRLQKVVPYIEKVVPRALKHVFFTNYLYIIGPGDYHEFAISLNIVSEVGVNFGRKV